MKQILKKAGGLLVIAALMLTGCQNREPDSGQDQPQTEAEISGETIQDEENPVLMAEGIRKITVSEGGDDLYSISYQPKENEETYEYWKMAVPYENKVIVDTEAMLEIYEILEGLDFTKVEAETENTGLENPGKEITLEFCQAKEDGEAPSSPKADSRCSLQIGNPDGEGNYYTSLKSSPQTIYRMNQNAIDAVINADTFSLILKVGAMVPVNTVEKVSVSIGQREYALSFDGENYYLDGQKTSQDNYKGIYTELLSVLLEKEIPEGGRDFSGEEKLHMEFKRNTDSLADVTVDYYAYDDTYAVLSIDGVKNFLVKQADVDNLIDMILKLEV